MDKHQADLAGDCIARSRLLKKHWTELSEQYLPVRPENSIWRYSRGPLPGDPEQGWKLHITATVLNAGEILRAVAPFLRSRGSLYKAPASLLELDKLNSGIIYGYSQVGKFLTVYPQTVEEAVLLARGLHRLTRRMDSLSVPFDLRYKTGSSVFYRYGAFKAQEVENHNGEHIYAIRDPEGNLVPDIRDSAAKPDWVEDPFLAERVRRVLRPALTPLQTTFKAFRALAQRGRGGVYQALDLSVTPPRLCILKEGRKNGEVSWDGRDGFWRVRHEGRVLASLLKAGINTPRVYSSFRAEKNYYLAIEFIEGESLDRWLGRKRRKLAVVAALKRSVELARLVAQIHAAGWVWRDCKPGNVVITKGGELRPLDFEGACPVDRPDPMPWGTPSYSSPEACDEFRGQSRLPEDLYALGATIYLLLAGCPPDAAAPMPLEKKRKNIPEGARRVVAELLDTDPRRRPNALDAARRLEAVLPPQTYGVRLRHEIDATREVGEPRVGAEVIEQRVSC